MLARHRTKQRTQRTEERSLELAVERTCCCSAADSAVLASTVSRSAETCVSRSSSTSRASAASAASASSSATVSLSQAGVTHGADIDDMEGPALMMWSVGQSCGVALLTRRPLGQVVQLLNRGL